MLPPRLILSAVLCVAGLANTGWQSVQAAALGAFTEKEYSAVKVFIDKIEISQPHLLPQQLLEAVLAGFQGREVYASELAALQNHLNKMYQEAGYITSGVIIPEQQIQNGVLKLEVVHGRLGSIENSGNKSLSNDYVNAIVAEGVTVPLNAKSLHNSLLLLKQHPLVEEVEAQLLPGARTDESRLLLDIKERSPYLFSASANNYLSPSVGEFQLQLMGGHQSLFGLRDRLVANASISKGVKDAGLSYTVPFTAKDHSLSVYFQQSRYAIVEAPFDEVDLESTTSQSGVKTSFTLQRKIHSVFKLNAAIVQKQSETSMLGETISLSPGMRDGEARTTSVQLGFNWRYRGVKTGGGLQGVLEKGLDANNATINETGPDGEYLLAKGSLHVMRRFSERNHRAHFRVGGQLTKDPLLSLQKFALGGARSVRGYRENYLVRDNGLQASIESQFNVYKGKLFLAPFIDAGRSWNNNNSWYAPNSAKYIYSIGAGVQWQANRHFNSELFIAKGLSDEPDTGNELQDKGVHFSLAYHW